MTVHGAKPKNIGHPLNTDQDEHGLIVSADGHTAYFASARYQGAGDLDIFGFELPKEARPDDILVVKGEVRNEKGELVRDATVEIEYMDTRKVEVIRVDSLSGRYATVVKLKAGSDVIMTVKKKDHVFDSRSFAVEDTVRAGVAKVDMTVQKIEVGKSYRVNDIKYADQFRRHHEVIGIHPGRADRLPEREPDREDPDRGPHGQPRWCGREHAVEQRPCAHRKGTTCKGTASTEAD
jgi:hypothetical protein